MKTNLSAIVGGIIIHFLSELNVGAQDLKKVNTKINQVLANEANMVQN